MSVVDLDAMIAAKNGGSTDDKTQNAIETTTADASVTTEAGDGGNTEVKNDQSVIKKFPTEEPDTTDANKPDANQNTTDASAQDEPEDEEVDLTQVLLNVDGEDRNVSELINERNEYARRIAEIDKDEFLKGFIDHYLATGNADAYLEAKAVNWDKKDDIEVLRAKFESENSDLDPKIVEKLWKRELADKYKQKPDLTQEEIESEDYEIAQGLLKRDAKNAREGFKANQSKFQIPERKVEKVEQAQQFDPKAYKQQLLADKEVGSFIKNKLLKIGVSDDAGTSFGFEVEDADSVVEMMTNDRLFWGTLMTDKGVDRAKQAKVYAYAKDPEKFEQALVDFGKTLALEERLKEVKNTDGKLNTQTVDGTSQGSWAKQFLTEGLKQKK